MWVFPILLILASASLTLQQQRVAPGVPPQHYQPPPPQQQFQQQQPPQYQQQQHVPVQQVQYQQPQQVPVQQQQQHQVPVQQQHQVPVQQVPVQQHAPLQHADHHQGTPGQILSPANMAHEREHIAEHLSVPIDTSKMSEQELQFHYFKMHDADNNNKLDGCELIKSLIHWHDGEEQEGSNEGRKTVQTDTELEALVDPILQDVDKNHDGFIDYAEFKRSEAPSVA